MHCFHHSFRVPHHIGSNRNPGMTLEESICLLDSDEIHTVTLLKQSKTSKAGLRPFFIDICHSASANENRAFHAPLLYNVVFTSSSFDRLLPGLKSTPTASLPRGKLFSPMSVLNRTLK